MPPAGVIDFPYPVREIENLWIELPDGCRLAARVWLPQTGGPTPAVIEYIPYGKRDGTRERDEAMHRYFAGHGYAALRVDLRGSGDSEGVLEDEYTEQEHRDGLEIIRWTAARPWCDGAVGMIGKSWGGFNALQIAGLAPASLKAVISVCAADDRYADDAHYMGGCLLNENQTWGAMLFTLAATPPDPAIVGDRWREMWLARLQATQPFPARWLQHPCRDDYWRHGSLCEDYDAVSCPVFAIGGWADGYSNAVPRLVSRLGADTRGLVGPWGHVYPHDGVPGPAIGFLDEAVGWWDRWLKGVQTEAIEPAYRVWMPGAGGGQIGDNNGGRWVAETGWPSPRTRPVTMFLGAAGLSHAPQPPSRRVVASPLTTGLAAGSWCAFGFQGELPLDQREDDGKSVCFDGPSLDQGVELLGAAVAEIELVCDQPVAMLAVRLNDVAPDGQSRRITYGLLNLCHRHGDDRVVPLTPGERVRVRITLNDVAWALAPGHRLRLALSNSYWPLVWPSPRRAAITLQTAGCRLHLPVRPPAANDGHLRPFTAPAAAPYEASVAVVDVPPERLIIRDPGSGTTRYVTRTHMREDGTISLDRTESIDLTSGHGLVETFSLRDDDPLSARVDIEQVAQAARGDWNTRIKSALALGCDETWFEVTASLKAWDGDTMVFENCWRERVRRNGI